MIHLFFSPGFSYPSDGGANEQRNGKSNQPEGRQESKTQIIHKLENELLTNQD